jgi:hypothetical protein
MASWLFLVAAENNTEKRRLPAVPLIAMAAIYAYLAGYGGSADDGCCRLHGRVLRLAASVYNQKFQCSYSLSAEQRTSLYCADAAVAHTAGTVLAAHLASNRTTAAVLRFTADLYNIVPAEGSCSLGLGPYTLLSTRTHGGHWWCGHAQQRSATTRACCHRVQSRRRPCHCTLGPQSSLPLTGYPFPGAPW